MLGLHLTWLTAFSTIYIAAVSGKTLNGEEHEIRDVCTMDTDLVLFARAQEIFTLCFFEGVLKVTLAELQIKKIMK